MFVWEVWGRSDEEDAQAECNKCRKMETDEAYNEMNVEHIEIRELGEVCVCMSLCVSMVTVQTVLMMLGMFLRHLKLTSLLELQVWSKKEHPTCSSSSRLLQQAY